jgi:hypothetical protein
VLITSITMVFATMTSYTRARAESLIKKCKVGFMERPERIVLFMIGAFTNRMAAVMWVIGVLSVVTVINRIQYTYLELNNRPQPSRKGLSGLFVRAFYWTGRADNGALRSVGHRDSRLRLAHSPRLARRPDGRRRPGVTPVGDVEVLSPPRSLSTHTENTEEARRSRSFGLVGFSPRFQGPKAPILALVLALPLH